tara:strand:+ start:37041 stop:37790 length:750 start_codon:yes stop_codon:yes gene_type:complete
MNYKVLMIIVLLVSSGASAQNESPKDIMQRVDRLLRGDSSQATATMEVVTEHWERQVRLEIWSLGTDYSLLRVLSPAKEAGTATLMSENDIWNYLPKVDRSIKMPASMMASSWMGSHFSNDDLVKESQLIEDYDINLSYRGDRDGTNVWEFELSPLPEAAVVWGRIIYQVRQSDYMPLWAKFFDENGNLSRTTTFSEFTEMGGRLIPLVMEMQPTDKPDEYTRIRYDMLQFNLGLDTSFFSLRNLKRQR